MEWLNPILQIAIPLILVILGFALGRVRETRHIRSLRQRERQPGPALTNLRRLPDGMRARRTVLCLGSVVIANDYYKAFGASLKHLVGGRLRTLETLLDRGRREAIQRMRHTARAAGAEIVLNVRLETSMVTGREKASGAVEVIAYGTGIITDD